MRIEWHLTNSYIPLEVVAHMSRARRVRADDPRGIRRHGARQGVDVRRLGGIVARLYRRRLARHPLGDRRRADPGRRHRRAEDSNGCRRSRPARCCRPRCSPSRTPAPTSPRSRPARCAQGDVYKVSRQQDLDHASGARRPDDLAGAHRPEAAGLSRAFDAARREAARHRRGSVPGARHVGRRDRGARLSRHEGIRDRLRRLRGEGGKPARRRRGAGLQATDADLRVGAHPDRGARDRRRAGRDGARAAATPRSACSSARS